MILHTMAGTTCKGGSRTAPTKCATSSGPLQFSYIFLHSAGRNQIVSMLKRRLSFFDIIREWKTGHRAPPIGIRPTHQAKVCLSTGWWDKI